MTKQNGMRLAAVIGIVGLGFFMLAKIERSLIFFPTKYPMGDWQPRGLSFQDVWFSSEDGTRLHGWLIKAKDPIATVLYAHGNAGHLADRASIVQHLSSELQFTVLIFDYRGYGRSEGVPDVSGILEDARAARKKLAELAGVTQKDVVLMGRSLGGAVAIDLASQLAAKALIVESTFSSLPDVAATIYPWIPARWLMKNPLDSAKRIRSYQGPYLQSHGDADRIIDFSIGQKLFEAANPPKRFIRLPGLDHNDLPPPFYYGEVKSFIQNLR